MSEIIFRDMVAKDVEHVLRMDSTLFDFPLDDVELLRFYRGTLVTCLVADQNVAPPGIFDLPVGYLIFERADSGLAVHRLGVPRGTMPYADRRVEIADGLIERLAMRLRPETSALIRVKEHDVELQLLLRDFGFRLVEVKRDQYPDGDDAYFFQLRYSSKPRKTPAINCEAFFKP